MHLPTSLDRPMMRPVTPIADAAANFRDASRQQPSNYVYRGDLLETAADRSYRPEYNLQVSPQNRRAIDVYQKIVNPQPVIGKILDGYI